MLCSQCQTENRPDRKFCKACGAELTRSCAACGFLNEPDDAFCGECGAALSSRAAFGATSSGQETTGAPSAGDAPRLMAGRALTELRHVSVLFCDLVGFTPLSESKDPEEVRELLSAYFDLARSVVARYGGVIQKFIGDAVMAVWGAPVANEDDAERAVRAALELVAAVSAYGNEHNTQLAARVGVMTGGAATTETPEEGMVIGDRVNTAARIQSLAPPGTCYVDETTRPECHQTW
jgi:class 3 adenylate cyclase